MTALHDRLALGALDYPVPARANRLILLALHLWLVRHLGVSAGDDARAPFSSHLRPLAGFALLLVAVVSALALASPATLLAPGVEGFEVTKLFWPFLWIYAAENFSGSAGC